MTEERALNFSNFNLRICRFKFPLYSVLQGQFCSTQELKLHDRTYFGSLMRLNLDLIILSHSWLAVADKKDFKTDSFRPDVLKLK